MKNMEFTTKLPGDEIFDPEEEAKLQKEVERIAAEFPMFSLADIRESLGVSQATLAIQMETTPERVAEIENKGIDVSVWEVLHMLNCLGCELEMYAELDGKKMDLDQAGCALARSIHPNLLRVLRELHPAEDLLLVQRVVRSNRRVGAVFQRALRLEYPYPLTRALPFRS